MATTLMRRISEQEPADGTENRNLVDETEKRLAMLRNTMEAKKEAYEKELERLQREIAYEKEALRARQEEQQQNVHLQTLRRELELLREDPDDSKTEFPGKQDDVPGNDPKAWSIAPSKAKEEWSTRREKQDNNAMDSVMNLVGLESVKWKFMEILDLIDAGKRRKSIQEKSGSRSRSSSTGYGSDSDRSSSKKSKEVSKIRFNAAFKGNPGTGKTTVAEIYAEFLESTGKLPDQSFVKTTGGDLAKGGVSRVKKALGELRRNGGLLFVHGVQPLASEKVRDVVEYMIHEMDRLEGQVAFVFSGTKTAMEEFLSCNKRLRLLVPFTFQFEDFEDHEILQILNQQLKDNHDGEMRPEKGGGGLYMRIVSRRIGRGRDRSEFGNAHEVEAALSQIKIRQGARVAQKRRVHEEADASFLSKIDLIGPPPSDVLKNSKAWKSMNELIGLTCVKDSVRVFISRAQENYERELDEEPPAASSLNRLLLGSPGTGKTTVAKLYGQILVDIGLLSRGEVLLKSPADFVGQAVGESEKNTKAILEAAKGNVLIIDEAYGLSSAGSGDSNSGTTSDSYKSAIIDTLVGEVQSTASEDRCVLLLGYKENMEKMFQSVNPALGRRFPISTALIFDDYSNDELKQILHQKLKQQGFKASDRAEEACMEVLRRARNHRNFGNAGEVDILLDKAKENQQKRLSAQGQNKDRYLLEPQDIDPDYDRLARAGSSIRELFADYVGLDTLVAKLEDFQRISQNAKEMSFDPVDHIPFNFLFKGPPGTGKTTVAEKMGHVFYEMGFLATKEVERCSATDLIGEYVGQTGPKTQKIFEKALGKVLFIDEAYRLADSSYGREAVTELTTILTLPKYKNKLVTILAGYDDEIRRLMTVNPGLTSRFPEVINFPSMSPENCCELLFKRLKDKLDTSTVQENKDVHRYLCVVFEKLSHLPDWGNARDIEALAKKLLGQALRSNPPALILTEVVLGSELNSILAERMKGTGDRTKPDQNGVKIESTPGFAQDQNPAAPPAYVHSHKLTETPRVVEILETDDDDEQDIKEHLMMSGLCQYGYKWNKEAGGWRCEGGTCFKSDKDVKREMQERI